MNTVETPFYVTGGTLGHDAPSYVERQADADLYDGLRRGEFCYVLTARQLGKSSLMVRTAVRLQAEGVAVAVLDLTMLGRNLTADQWYYGLLGLIGQQLELWDELKRFWLENTLLSPLQRWIAALREVVLADVMRDASSVMRNPTGGAPDAPYALRITHHASRLVIFIDEIDAVRSLPFSTDEFFAAIRGCYNQRARDAEFRGLTFCLLGVATPSDLIQETRTTPFNIGRRIELTDFTEAEAAPLAWGLSYRSHPSSLIPHPSSPEAQRLLRRVLYWTGGHPYLTQRLCQAVAEEATRRHGDTGPGTRGAGGGTDDPLAIAASPRLPVAASPREVDRLCEELFLSGGAREKDDNLLFVRDRLLDSEVDLASLLDLYAHVWGDRRPRDDEANPLVSVLSLAGITRTADARRQASGVRGAGQASGVRRQLKRLLTPDAWRLTSSLTPDAYLQVRNRIYARVFDREWITQHMPDAELRRQRAAYRRGLLRATAVAGVIVTVMAGLALTAARMARRAQDASAYQRIANRRMNRAMVRAQLGERSAQRALAERTSALKAREEALEQERLQRERADREKRTAKLAQDKEEAAQQLAERQRQRAEAGELKVRRNVYVTQINAAQQAWEAGSVGRAMELLESQRPGPGREDVRGWEWRYLWRRGQSDAPFTLRGHEGVVHCAAFSPDGKTLATGSEDRTVRLWDVSTRRTVALLTGHADQVRAVAFAPDGQTLATGGQDNTVRLWNVATRRAVDKFTGHEGPVVSVVFSPDGRTLATGSRDTTARLWDVASRRSVATLEPHALHVTCVVFSPDGRLLATGHQDRSAALWDVAVPRPEGTRHPRSIATFSGFRDIVSSVAFSPDGKTLATACGSERLKLWDVETRKELSTLHGSNNQDGLVAGALVAFSPDGKLLATGREDTVVLWDLASQREVAIFRGHQKTVHALVFSPDSKTLATGSTDQTAKLWHAAPRPELANLVGHDPTHPVRAAFSPDGKILATGSDDNTARLWDAATKKELATLRGHTAGVAALAFSPGGKTLATGSADKTVKLWDVAVPRGRPREIATLQGQTGEVRALAFSPNGKTLATASGIWLRASIPGEVRLWDVASRREMATIKGFKGRVNAVAFSPDGVILAVGGEDKAVKLWQVASRRVVATLQEPSGVVALAFSPDGRTLATARWDGAISLWDVARKQPAGTFQAHARWATAVTFSSDGQRLVTGSWDSTVKVWDLATLQEVTTLRGHPSRVWSVAFSPDGNTLVTAGAQGTVLLWRAAPRQ